MKRLGPGITIAGIVFLVAASLLFFVGVPLIINDKVTEETRLVNGSDTWNKWKDVPIPILFKIHFFNITNPDAIKPSNSTEETEWYKVQELGPYVWQEERHKEIIELSDEDDTVTYREYITYHFRPDLSNGTEDDVINTINFPFAAIATNLKKLIYGLANMPIDYLVQQGETFVRRNQNVREMLFTGLELHPFYKTILDIRPGGIPPQFAGYKFAFFRGKNGSFDGEFKVNRGVRDYTQFGEIISMDGKEELDWWTDKSKPSYEEQYCNKINGSDGSLFPPFVEKDRIVYAFSLDICRSIFTEFSRENEFHGIDSYIFAATPNLLAHPDINPDNRCFCPNPGGRLNAECRGGVLRIFPCKSGGPVIVSKPHFLQAEEIFIERVPGIQPDPSKHDTEIEIEPRSGMLLRAQKRIQISAELQPLEGITYFQNVPNSSYIVPIFWVEEHAELDEKNINELKDMLVKPLEIVNIAQWSVIGVLIVVIIGGVVLTFIQRD